MAVGDILAIVPDCVKILDLDGRLKQVNDAGLALLEVTDPSALVGMLWKDLWPLDLQPTIIGAIQSARAGRSTRFSAAMPSPRGDVKHWDVTVAPSRDATGAICAVLAVSRDVTRQLTTERSLQTSETRFRALADNIAQFAWMADPSGYIYWYNKRWFDYTGTTLDDMRGWGWQKVHHPDHVDRVTKKFAACIESGNIWEDVFPLRAEDGTYRWFLSRARPSLDENGQIQFWCGTNTDISDQRTATARLRQLARLIELSHEAIIVWDLDGGIVLWNRGCEELYGHAREAALNRTTGDLLKTHFPVPAEEVAQRLKEDGAWSGELRHTAADGSQVWVESRQEIIRLGGRDVVLETNRDITERRASDEARTLLIGELNHRVKNTLATVQSIASQMALTSEDVGEFVKGFRSRLGAMASAYDILTEAQWAGADLRGIVESQLDAAIGNRDVVVLSGPDVRLPRQTAILFAQLIHELALNATQHGALSDRAGRVAIDWQVNGGKEPRIDLHWREIGGPRVSAARKPGFGTTLIERAGRVANVKTELEFRANGLEGRISAKLPAGGDAQDFFDVAKRRTEPFKTLQTLASKPVRAAPRRLLIYETDPLIAMELDDVLSDAGYLTIGPALTLPAAKKAVLETNFDLALLGGSLVGEEVGTIIASLKDRGIPYICVIDGDDPLDQMDGVAVLMRPIDHARLMAAVEETLGAKVD